jgi:RNA polymerase sigma factor (sigma-70 family)
VHSKHELLALAVRMVEYHSRIFLRKVRYSSPDFQLWRNLTEMLEPEEYRTIPLDESPGQARRIAIEEASALLVMALQNINEPTRTVIEMHYLNGYTNREIAASLGLTTQAVCHRIAKGLQQLRKEIASSKELSQKLKDILNRP